MSEREEAAPQRNLGRPDTTELGVYTITEAAQVCGVHRNTIRRYLDAGRFPGAFREDEAGPWRIPHEDLDRAGLRITSQHEADARWGPRERESEADQLVEALRDEIAGLKRRAEVAEAVSHERQERIADLRRALDAGRSESGDERETT